MACDSKESKWTIIQQRVDDSLNFTKSWAEYEQGFGDISANYWAGLSFMNNATHHKPNRLRIMLEPFERSSLGIAIYNTFSVGNALSKYKISVDGFSGDNIGDSLAAHNKMMFTTFDSDNDKEPSKNCAIRHKCGWWMRRCFKVCLNGEYRNESNNKCLQGLLWDNLRSLCYSYKRAIMSISVSNYD